jgi:hypothetical protein
LQRDFKVVSKGLTGKHDTPFVKLVSEYGDKVTWHFSERKELDDFHIEEVFTVKIVQEQVTLDSRSG